MRLPVAPVQPLHLLIFIFICYEVPYDRFLIKGAFCRQSGLTVTNAR